MHIGALPLPFPSSFIALQISFIFSIQKSQKESWQQKVEENEVADLVVEDSGSLHPWPTDEGCVGGNVEAPECSTPSVVYGQQEPRTQKTWKVTKNNWVAIKSKQNHKIAG